VGDRYVMTGQAADALGVSAVTLQRWAHAGQVKPAYRTPGGHFRWQLDGPGGLREQLRTPPAPGTPGGAPDPAAPLRPAIVAAIVTSKLGVLVERRHDGKPLWTFPAGESEPGESPEDTAIREAKEETGLIIKVSHVIGERLKHPATGRHMIYVAARPYQGTAVYVGDEAELAEVRWVRLAEADDLLPGMFEPVREHLRRVLR
jgi:8-oxo-dGTP pyrophosphatase MutT (NUDIX family)